MAKATKQNAQTLDAHLEGIIRELKSNGLYNEKAKEATITHVLKDIEAGRVETDITEPAAQKAYIEKMFVLPAKK